MICTTKYKQWTVYTEERAENEFKQKKNLLSSINQVCSLANLIGVQYDELGKNKQHEIKNFFCYYVCK